MGISKDLARIHEAGKNWAQTEDVQKSDSGDAWYAVSRAYLKAMRKLSPEQIDAMLKVEWPETMTPAEQMQALMNAAINVALQE